MIESALQLENVVDRRTALTPFYELLKGVHDSAVTVCRPRYYATLSSVETAVQQKVDSLAHSEGAWYRPIHNMIVPLMMRAICRASGTEADLFFAAQLHDTGYSAYEIPGTLAGSQWQNMNVREGHMLVSASILEQTLQELCESGQLDLSVGRINELARIVETHDDPYLGRPIVGLEALLHRDADRCFVLSFVSFWKDYIAALCDGNNRWAAYFPAGHVLTPEDFLHIRASSFFANEEELPAGLIADTGVLNTAFHALNDGLGFEPATSALAQTSISQMISDRYAETAAFADLSGPEWEGFCTRRVADEMNWVFGLSE